MREHRAPSREPPLRFGLTILALATLAIHLATLSRYGFYGDELYFLACFKHLAWGFADQPPLVPLISGLASVFPNPLFGMRLLPAIAAALTTLVAAAMAREFGAGRFGQVVAATATALMPASLFLGNTLTTTSFEPLMWSLTILLAIKIARGSRRVEGGASWQLPALILIVAIAAYVKYSIFLLVAALAIGALLARNAKLALRVALAGLASLALLAPNIAWQAMHGFPMLAVLHGDMAGRHAWNGGLQVDYSGTLRSAAAFGVEQLLYAGPVAAVLWIAGIAALVRRSELRAAAFIGVAYVIGVAAAIALLAKGYYLIGFYPALFAAGAVWLERLPSIAKRAYTAVFLAASVVVAPLALPVLPVDSLIAYTHAFGAPPKLIQPLFADEFGWEELTRAVAVSYYTLPAAIRARTPIFADTYGDAAALAYFGPRYRLPAPISAQDQYYLWGTRGYALSRMLAVGASEYRTLRRFYRNVTMLGTYTDPYRWVLEGPTPIYLCTDPVVPLSKIWPALKWFGEYGRAVH